VAIMVKEAIILAGGLGTRLRKVVKDIPKPMADINGKPFLEYLLYYLKQHKIEKVILAVSYKWKVIKNYFGTNFEGIKIIYSVEDTPLGTGGAIKKASTFCNSEDLLILNGDTYFDVNLGKFYKLHKEKKSRLSIALKEMKNFSRYGTVKIDDNNRIIGFLEKKFRKKGLINGGIYLINKSFLQIMELPSHFSFEKDFLEKFYKTFPFYGFLFDNYFIDIGIPEDYERAKRDFEKFKDK
jgi:D-glycero-alpha-D-manno-heptose 1-phosphate guanylyltransferase